MPRLSRPKRKNPELETAPKQNSSFNITLPNFAAITANENNPLNGFKPPSLPTFLDLPFKLSIIREDDQEHPNRRKLGTVQEFFRYTDAQDKEFFKELDRDGDGKVGVEDLKQFLANRNLPHEYAHQFINRARGTRWWSSQITFTEFKSLLDDSESKMLKSFCTLEVEGNGTLDLTKIKASLKKLNLPDTEENAKAMMSIVGKEEDASVAYGEFRRFVMLLPRDKLISDTEPNVTWFESATCVPIGPPQHTGDGAGKKLLQAALAGGLSSGVSTLLLHPLDTLKTRIQSIPGATISSVVKSVPTIGRRAMYRGIVPAASGAFSSHGIRTCGYEACLMMMGALGIPYMQAQPVASLVGTVAGTFVRIPCEVLKQQLQAGRHENVRAAASDILRIDGKRGLFRGSSALMSREVPFYVFGMVLYEQYKRVATGEAWGHTPRQLSNQEYIAIGALAGASASLLTTPADVLKSRMMTAAAGSNVPVSKLLANLIEKEGIMALFKGALPRCVWIAPLGAMNFAGYELAKRAMAGPTSTESTTTTPKQLSTAPSSETQATSNTNEPLLAQSAPMQPCTTESGTSTTTVATSLPSNIADKPLAHIQLLWHNRDPESAEQIEHATSATPQRPALRFPWDRAHTLDTTHSDAQAQQPQSHTRFVMPWDTAQAPEQSSQTRTPFSMPWDAEPPTTCQAAVPAHRMQMPWEPREPPTGTPVPPVPGGRSTFHLSWGKPPAADPVSSNSTETSAWHPVVLPWLRPAHNPPAPVPVAPDMTPRFCFPWQQASELTEPVAQALVPRMKISMPWDKHPSADVAAVQVPEPSAKLAVLWDRQPATSTVNSVNTSVLNGGVGNDDLRSMASEANVKGGMGMPWDWRSASKCGDEYVSGVSDGTECPDGSMVMADKYATVWIKLGQVLRDLSRRE